MAAGICNAALGRRGSSRSCCPCRSGSPSRFRGLWGFRCPTLAEHLSSLVSLAFLRWSRVHPVWSCRSALLGDVLLAVDLLTVFPFSLFSLSFSFMLSLLSSARGSWTTSCWFSSFSFSLLKVETEVGLMVVQGAVVAAVWPVVAPCPPRRAALTGSPAGENPAAQRGAPSPPRPSSPWALASPGCTPHRPS